MHVKALGSSRKHARGCPLVGPETNLREDAFVAPDKFAKKSTVPLRVKFCARKFPRPESKHP